VKSEEDIRSRLDHLRRYNCGPFDDMIEAIRELEWVLDE